MHVPTPHGRALVEALVRAPFYSRDQYSIDIREPRSVLRNTSVREMTRPISAPLLDIDQELWQFSHVTYSYVLRVFIAAVLLAYGMIRDNPLPMIGGLAFLPFTPLVLGLAFGILTRQPKLVVQNIVAFIAGVLLLTAGGAAVAAFADPPLMFDKFPPLAAGVFFSFAIGVAAAIATADDAGHRQLIGLAAASQIALIPAWFGVSVVFGFDEGPGEKWMAFGFNAGGLVLGAAAVYIALVSRAEAARAR